MWLLERRAVLQPNVHPRWHKPHLTSVLSLTLYICDSLVHVKDSRQMSRRSWCILCAHGVVVRNVAHDLHCSSSSHFPCCFFFNPLRPRKQVKEKNEHPNHWLQKAHQLNQWPGKVTADHRRVSVIHLGTSCLKRYSSALFAVSSVNSLNISLWCSPQIPGVCHITTYPYRLPACGRFLLCIPTFAVSHWILTVMMHIWQVFWMCQNTFSTYTVTSYVNSFKQQLQFQYRSDKLCHFLPRFGKGKILFGSSVWGSAGVF